MIKNLEDNNFLNYAAENYNNPQCFDSEEFMNDIKRFKYIKKLFSRYHESKRPEDLKERLILNHIIILYNVFGLASTTRMLFFKLDGYHHYLKPFLVLLNKLPDIVEEVNENDIYTSDIKMDEKIIEVLRHI